MRVHILLRRPASALFRISFFPRQPSHFLYVPLTANTIGSPVLISTDRGPVHFLPFSLLHLHPLVGHMVQGYAR